MFKKPVKPVGFYPLPIERGYLENNCKDVAKPEQQFGNLLYIHIPFCNQRCSFCFFYLYSSADKLLDNYIDALLSDIYILGKTSFVKSLSFEAAFIGGGSPSCLKSYHWKKIFNSIKENFNFVDNSEISVEWYPSDSNSEQFELIRDLGVNRISFGIQALSATKSKELHLKHSIKESLESLSLAKKVGFDSINADLIISTPSENKCDLKSELELLIESDISCLTLNPLATIPGTPLYSEISKNTNLKSYDEIQASLRWSRSFLLDAGYKQQRFYNWNKKTYSHKYNKLTANPNVNIVGVGAGAYGWVNGCAYLNTTNLNEYISTTRSMESQVRSVYFADEEERKRAFIITSLLELEVSGHEYKKAFGVSFIDDFSKIINDLVSNDYCELINENLLITEKGVLWGDNICELFYSKLQKKMLNDRFSSNNINHHYSPKESRFFRKVLTEGVNENFR